MTIARNVVLTTMRGPRDFISVAALAGALTTAHGAARAAQSVPCTAVTVTDAPWLDRAWRAALDDLRAQIAALPTDECPRVALALVRRRDVVVLRATAADGRTGEREVRDASALAAIALGLVAAIPVEPAASAPPVAPVAPAPDAEDIPPRAPATAPRAIEEPAIQISLGAAIGPRVGEPTRVLMADFEAHADLFARGWLIVASARFGPLGTRIGGAPIASYAYNEFGLGLGVGRRISVGDSSFDVVLMPMLVLMNEEGGTSGVPGDSASTDDKSFRMDLSVRWTFARTGRWAWALMLDGDVAPGAIQSPPRPDVPLPLLPSWTTGSRLGVAGDLF